MEELSTQFSWATQAVPALLLFGTIAFLLVWSVVWKGLALWHAARRSHKGWFIAILLINTLGILEICYIFLVARKEEGK